MTIPCSKYILLTLFLLFQFGHLFARESKKDRLENLFMPKEKANYSNYLKKSTNELETTAAILFVGYKSFLSDQDMGTCVFSPSCSVYAIQSLQNDHAFTAYLKIFDRLTRCHPFSKKGQYPYLNNTGLLYDPIH